MLLKGLSGYVFIALFKYNTSTDDLLKIKINVINNYLYKFIK